MMLFCVFQFFSRRSQPYKRRWIINLIKHSICKSIFIFTSDGRVLCSNVWHDRWACHSDGLVDRGRDPREVLLVAQCRLTALASNVLINLILNNKKTKYKNWCKSIFWDYEIYYRHNFFKYGSTMKKNTMYNQQTSKSQNCIEILESW